MALADVHNAALIVAAGIFLNIRDRALLGASGDHGGGYGRLWNLKLNIRCEYRLFGQDDGREGRLGVCGVLYRWCWG